MLDATTLDCYRELRQRFSASQALRLAKRTLRSDPFGDTGLDIYPGDAASFEREGFTIRVSLDYDEYTEPYYMGAFTAHHPDVPGTVDRKETGDWSPGRHRKDYRFWSPTGASGTWEEIYSYYRDTAKLGKHAAWLAASRQIRNMHQHDERTCSGDLPTYTVTVTASRSGIELGHASVGGGQGDDTGDLIRDMLGDLLSQAIDDARQNLDTLCTCEAA